MPAPAPVPSGAPCPLWDPERPGAAPVGRQCGDCAWAQLGGRGRPVLRCQRHRGARLHPSWPACPAFIEEVRCEDCGACCREAFHVVELGARDPFRRRHPALVDREDGRFVLRRAATGRCPCLDGDGAETDYRCTVYDDRPRTCRDFTLGSANCCEARRRVGLSR